MISNIDISGYKSIKKQSIPLNPINVIIGGNGVGKSNFISIFSLVRAIYEGELSSYLIKKGGADHVLHFGKKQTKNITLDFCFESENKEKNRFIIQLENTQDSLFVKSTDTAYFWHEKWNYNNFEKNIQESSFKEINTGQAFFVNPLLQEFKVYHFHDTGDDSPIKSPSLVHDNSNLKKDGSNIAAFLYLLKIKHPKHFKRIEKTIQSIAPFFGGFVLEPLNLNDQSIKLQWIEKGEFDAYFDGYSLSDGTLRFICLTTLLMQPDPPKTIIIDEPELGLHPVAIHKISNMVKKIADKTQVIISTQSTTLLDNFEPNDIIVANRKGNETIFNRLNENELSNWLEEYSIGDVWSKNIIGGQPF